MSIIIIPIGIILFLKQYNIDKSITDAVINTVAALVGMIPEGLILLTSTVLAVSVIKLSKRKVLVQQLYCIETLARVDTVCLDKTGTLTEGSMEVEDVIVLNDKCDYKNILSLFSRTFTNENRTMEAISKKYNKSVKEEIINKESFSSGKKYSSITTKSGKYILGAPDILDTSSKMKELLIKYKDYRTLLLQKDNKNIALILLTDKIRFQAKQILEYLKKQNVNIKIISGDNEEVITRIAKRLDFDNIKCIDMSQNKTNMNHLIVENYNIFSRVSPEQKRDLIKSLKNNGHIVAMIGDGVNDVLALKESDCSIAMASGSDAARNVSEMVLLDSDFESVPKIIEEGRRVINNIERSASLFLTKTIYATLLAILFIFINISYPFEPIQLSLISAITIGIPAFILALEPNYNIVRGNFFINILKKSIPGGFTILINIVSVVILSNIFKFNSEIISTMAVVLVAMTGFILLFKICDKFNKIRFFMFLFLIILFISCIIGLPEFFEIVILKPIYIIYIAILFVLDIGLFNVLYNLFSNKIEKNKERIIKKV